MKAWVETLSLPLETGYRKTEILLDFWAPHNRDMSSWPTKGPTDTVPAREGNTGQAHSGGGLQTLCVASSATTPWSSGTASPTASPLLLHKPGSPTIPAAANHT